MFSTWHCDEMDAGEPNTTSRAITRLNLNHSFDHRCWLLVRTVSWVSDVGHVVHGHCHCLSLIFLNSSGKTIVSFLQILRWIYTIFIKMSALWSCDQKQLLSRMIAQPYKQFLTCPRHIPGLYTNMLKSWLNKWHMFWYIYIHFGSSHCYNDKFIIYPSHVMEILWNQPTVRRLFTKEKQKKAKEKKIYDPLLRSLGPCYVRRGQNGHVVKCFMYDWLFKSS